MDTSLIISRIRTILFLFLILGTLSGAVYAATVSTFTPGPSLTLNGQYLNLSAPICAPTAGDYAVMFRASTAAGCTTRSVGASDDFATLVFTSGTGGAGATYTMPQSKVSNFTGSISGSTLTTPANAVVVGSLITDTTGKIVDNTYVIASTNSTTWTVNNSQTVASETMTQSIYPPGEGTCFKNQSIGVNQSLLTINASTSLIRGAGGVISGNPAVQGGPVILYPGGEACLQADLNNNYLVTGFLPGAWYIGAPVAATVSAFQWIGLNGYHRLHLGCSAVGVITSSGSLVLQLAYNGVFQTTGYSYAGQGVRNLSGGGNFAYSPANGTLTTGFLLTSPLPTGANNGATLDIDLGFANGTGMGFSNDLNATTRSMDSGSSTEEQVIVAGTAPLTTTANVTGIQLFPSAGTMFGMCWLTPKI